jgi:hypothetical protein
MSFFYFKVDGKYGKGEVHWTDGGKETQFGYTLIFNPDGTRNLVSQEPPR